MNVLGGKRRILTGRDPALRDKLAALQEDFVRALRSWRRAHPAASGRNRALFEEARALRSLGKKGEAASALAALEPRGLSPGERLLAAQWLAELGAPPYKAAPLLKGLGAGNLPSFRERFLLAALLSREPGKEETALSLLGGLSPGPGNPDPAKVRKRVEDLEKALPGLPEPLARSLRGLLYRRWLELLPETPERPVLEAALAGLRLKPGDPLPPLEGKDLEGKPWHSPSPGPLLLLFWESRNPASLEALKEAAALAGAPSSPSIRVAAPLLDLRKRDLEKIRARLPRGVTLLWDGKGRRSPLALAFAVDRTPFLVLADSKGRILYLGLTENDLREKIDFFFSAKNRAKPPQESSKPRKEAGH